MVHAVRAAGFASVTAVGADVAEPASISPVIAPDPEWEDVVLRDGFADITARHRAGDLIGLCSSARPDVIVADEVDFGALIAAEVQQIPYATVVVLVAGGFARPELLVDPLSRVSGRRGAGAPAGRPCPGRRRT